MAERRYKPSYLGASWRTNDQIQETSAEKLERYWPHCHAGQQPQLSPMGERWPYAGCVTWMQAASPQSHDWSA